MCGDEVEAAAVAEHLRKCPKFNSFMGRGCHRDFILVLLFGAWLRRDCGCPPDDVCKLVSLKVWVSLCVCVCVANEEWRSVSVRSDAAGFHSVSVVCSCALGSAG